MAAGPLACHEAMLSVAPLTKPATTSAVPLRPCAGAKPPHPEPASEKARESRKDFAFVHVLGVETGHVRDDTPPFLSRLLWEAGLHGLLQLRPTLLSGLMPGPELVPPLP
eukprot:11648088-Alexandrium_andersonii.AAC.1